VLRVVTESWDMPNLHAVTISENYNTKIILTTLFQGLFQVHCRGLLSLQVRGPGGAAIPSLISHCPLLEHLIIVKDSWLFSKHCAGHPTVKWIDLWSSEQESLAVSRQRLHRFPWFPNLQSIRELDKGLVDSSELPFIFPPNSTSDPDDQAVELYHFPGTGIVVHKHYIRAVHYDSDSDTSYSWSGTLSDLEDSSDSSTTSMDWEACELQNQDDVSSEELGSEDVLDVFTKMLVDED
jgi:hypothetical protein